MRETGIEMFSDADFAGDGKDRNSTTGALITYQRKEIAWRSSKQSMVALSTAEVEYICMSQTIQAARMVHKLATEINVHPTGSMNFWSDN